MVAGYQVLLYHEHHGDQLDPVADHELVVNDIQAGLTVLDVRTGVKSVLLARSIMVWLFTVHYVMCMCYMYCVLCYVYFVLCIVYCTQCIVYCVMCIVYILCFMCMSEID